MRPDRLLRAAARTGATLAAVGLVVSACSSSASQSPRVTGSSPVVTTPSFTTASPTTSPATPVTPVTEVPPSSPAPSPAASSTTAPRPEPASSKTASSSSHRAHTASSPTTKSHLPLSYSTGNARQVITVTAASTTSTRGTLQAWQRSGSTWTRVGPAVTAWLGSDGLSTHPSESRSATPIGSFTLTQAFGHDKDPGTALPYTRTTPADWWISQPGPLYNTRQRCSSSCSFTQGDPNEHLYYETPDYDYAVVIDYNTRNAPGGVTQGAGSAFFLHVTEGKPTAGCVSIPAAQLTRIMRWLDPDESPRIVIGV